MSSDRGDDAWNIASSGTLALLRIDVVVMDAERIAAEQRDVVPLAGMDFAVESRRIAIRRREMSDRRRMRGIEDLVVVPVLFHDDEDVRIPWDGEIRRRRIGERRRRWHTAERQHGAGEEREARARHAIELGRFSHVSPPPTDVHIKRQLVLDGDAFFGVLSIEVRLLLFEQPSIGRVAMSGIDVVAQPFENLLITSVSPNGRVELRLVDSPPLEDALIHRAGIDVVVNRSVGGGASFIEDALEPQESPELLTPTPRDCLAGSNVGSHTARNHLSPRGDAAPSAPSIGKASQSSEGAEMIRGMGVRGAVALNVITMIGIGPLITIPLVLATMPGPGAMAAWIIGAALALCDGLVWAELGSLFPGSGGTYGFLRETFGRGRLGDLLAFLFAWQVVLSAPLVLASGYIGFAHYAAYLWPALADWRAQAAVAAGVGILTIVLLHRSIVPLSRLSVMLGAVAVGTIVLVVAAAMGHADIARLAPTGHSSETSSMMPFAGLGAALVITLYDYLGYGQSCTVGDEVRAPATTLPRSIVISIVLVAALYLALQAGVLAAIDWHELIPPHPGAPSPPMADYVASTVVARSWGTTAACAVTIAILVTAFASTFGNLLGFARIPYAAARDGLFPRVFGRLHRDGFPVVSLQTIGWLAIPACFLSLTQVIGALTTGLIVVQSLAQIAAVVALRRRGVVAPARIWLYPLPAILALLGWLFIFCSSGTLAIAFGLVSVACGVAVYLIVARCAARWPFAVGAFALAIGVFGMTDPTSAATPTTYGHSAVVHVHGHPEFTVDGAPFFVNGAAFFYERIPRSQWDDDLARMRTLGINTIDLYVMWNWHEPAAGVEDFDGHTNPRRDLRTLPEAHRQVRLPRHPCVRVHHPETSGRTGDARRGCSRVRSTACRRTSCSQAAIHRRPRFRTRAPTTPRTHG